VSLLPAYQGCIHQIYEQGPDRGIGSKGKRRGSRDKHGGARLVRLFLSYAKEDRDTADEIADRLMQLGFTIYNWRDPTTRGGRFVQQIQQAINSADAFLTLLSPNFVESEWCGREKDLAIQREQDLRKQGRESTFVHVLKIADTPPIETGFLRSYDWVDLTTPASMEAELPGLAGRLRSAHDLPLGGTDTATDAAPLPPFRNREDELERVLRGLSSPAGPHFWLVIAPPQLGKSWFLNQVSKNNAQADPRWVTKKIDLREHADLRGNALLLLGHLFGGTAAREPTEPAMIRNITRQISGSAQPHLCLVDSAELLDAETADTLRSYLSKIYNNVQEAGIQNLRLGLIVASRRDDQWRGVHPVPRLGMLPLTEFRDDVARHALYDLAEEMGRTFAPSALRLAAERVHRLTEGLPALLVRCLQWIRDEAWVEMERMENQALFEELANPYIQTGLLAQDSLLPWHEGQDDEPLRALEQAFRLLAPYRLFTQSHLQHHLKQDPGLSTTLAAMGWSVTDLWRAISGTALLTKPLDEPWQEIYGAIRRLFYRYYYRSSYERAAAHREAGEFVADWAAGQVGKEQVIGLVECLWHQAAALRLSSPAEMPQELARSAQRLSQGLHVSSAYTLDELRDYAAERMRNDDELQHTVSNVSGLFNRLIQLVVKPPQELLG